jgi:hypothetical protein
VTLRAGPTPSGVGTTRQIGYAVSSTQLFLNTQQGSSSASPSTILFADAIFANNFRITEGQGEPQALDFLNENGQNSSPCPIVFTAREALLTTPSVAFANEEILLA